VGIPHPQPGPPPGVANAPFMQPQAQQFGNMSSVHASIGSGAPSIQHSQAQGPVGGPIFEDPWARMHAMQLNLFERMVGIQADHMHTINQLLERRTPARAAEVVPPPAARMEDNQWKIKVIGYFNPDLPIEGDGLGDYAYVGTDLHYKNVTIFI